mgnify:CR=1 FL=1
MLMKIVVGLATLAVALVGVYCFTLGRTYVVVGAGLYVAAWIVWLLARRRS